MAAACMKGLPIACLGEAPYDIASTPEKGFVVSQSWLLVVLDTDLHTHLHC